LSANDRKALRSAVEVIKSSYPHESQVQRN
jgi:hypothetical protein